MGTPVPRPPQDMGQIGVRTPLGPRGKSLKMEGKGKEGDGIFKLKYISQKSAHSVSAQFSEFSQTEHTCTASTWSKKQDY